MSYPSNKNEFNNITREKLDSMSAAELLELLESINENMTEDNFDDELITACLDALDKKSPVPEHMTDEESWQDFKAKLEPAAPSAGEVSALPKRRAKRVLRTGLVAAIIVFSLFTCMVAATAAGVNVFGSIARWTDSVFGFEQDEGKAASEAEPISFEECMELLALDVPEGFIMSEPMTYQDEATGYKEGAVDYYKDPDYIMLTIFEAPGGNGSVFEKDDNDVEIVDIGSCRFYVFSNNANSVAAWRYHQFECGVITSLDREALISILYESYADIV